jgi:hypothetical protein
LDVFFKDASRINDTFVYGMQDGGLKGWHVKTKYDQRTYAVFYGPKADLIAEAYCEWLNAVRTWDGKR